MFTACCNGQVTKAFVNANVSGVPHSKECNGTQNWIWIYFLFIPIQNIIIPLFSLPQQSNGTQRFLATGEKNLSQKALKLSLNSLLGSDERTEPVNYILS